MKRFVIIFSAFSLLLIAFAGNSYSAGEALELNKHGFRLYKARKYTQAAEVFREAVKSDPSFEYAHYNLACTLSILYGRKNDVDLDELFNHLDKTLILNKNKLRKFAKDSDLDPIRNLKRYKALIERYSNKKMTRHNTNIFLIPYKKGSLYGYCDNSGKIIIEPRYKNAGLFFNERAHVQNQEDFSGYINKKGKLVIPFEYERAYNFSDGIALVYDEYGRYKFIDISGKIIEISNIPEDSHITEPYGFREGLFVVNKVVDYSDGIGPVTSSFVVNISGEILIPENKFYNISPFTNGISVASKGLDRNFCLINRKGKVLLDENYYSLKPPSEGLCLAFNEYKAGFVDLNGKTVIPFQYSDGGSFSEGLAPVSIMRLSGEKKYGYISKVGETVIPHQFYMASEFSHGLAHVVPEKPGSWSTAKGYLINKKGVKKLTLPDGTLKVNILENGVIQLFKSENDLEEVLYMNVNGRKYFKLL